MAYLSDSKCILQWYNIRAFQIFFTPPPKKRELDLQMYDLFVVTDDPVIIKMLRGKNRQNTFLVEKLKINMYSNVFRQWAVLFRDFQPVNLSGK